ncbi:MucBP domain-containing protein [Listeria costaricensis]|uniref:MucBP domain-containing protein n=1 Tax=Listeria costaricensis TaxID=2026604 RepID=UPI0013C44E07|nr:MucBP domain-containing protein [Listeria costaricensis]
MNFTKKTLAVLLILLLAFTCIRPTLADEETILTLSIEETSEIYQGKAFTLHLSSNSDSDIQMTLPEGVSFITSPSANITVQSEGQVLSIKFQNGQSTEADLELQANQTGDVTLAAEQAEAKATLSMSVQPNAEQQNVPSNNLKSDDGWTHETNHLKIGEIPLKDGTTLCYQFGGDYPQTRVPSAITMDQDVIPHVYFKDASGNKIYTLSGGDNKTASSYISFYDSNYLEYTEIPNMNLQSFDFYYKTQANGLLALKLVFPLSVGRGSCSMTIEMDGQTDGSVKVTETLTNNHYNTLRDMSMINKFDIAMEGNEGIEIQYTGDNKGLSVTSPDGKYQLNYLFSDGSGFSNWSGYKDQASSTSPLNSNPFNTNAGTGQEALNGTAGTVAYSGTDTAIYAKSQPLTLAADGGTVSYNYTISAGPTETKSAPELSLDQATTGTDTVNYYGNDYAISGTWTDADSESVDLYYQIGSESPVKFASQVANTQKGAAHAYSYTIPAEQILAEGFVENKQVPIKVYATDTSSLTSSSEQVTLKEQLCEVTVQYLDASGNTIHANATLKGQMGTSYQATQLTIDGYTYKETVGTANGTFSAPSETVQFIYDQKPSTLGIKVSNGSSAITKAYTGDTLQYNASFVPPFDQPSTTKYQSADFTVTGLANFSTIDQIKLENEDREQVGVGTVDASDPSKMHIHLTSTNVPGDEMLRISFKGTIAEDTADQSIIRVQISADATFTNGVSTSCQSTAPDVLVETGSLAFASVPNTLTFSQAGGEMIPLSAKSYAATPDQALSVKDDRSTGHKWNMSVRLSSPLTGESSNELLAANVFYYHDGQKYLLSDEVSAPVMTGNADRSNATTDISSNWEKGVEGPEVTVDGNSVKAETYHCTLNWTLQDAP